MAKSYPPPITDPEMAITAPNSISVNTKEVYTAVFTYDSSAKTAKMYVLDAKTDDLKAYSEVETAIPGKVVRYRANL